MDPFQHGIFGRSCPPCPPTPPCDCQANEQCVSVIRCVSPKAHRPAFETKQRRMAGAATLAGPTLVFPWTTQTRVPIMQSVQERSQVRSSLQLFSLPRSSSLGSGIAAANGCSAQPPRRLSRRSRTKLPHAQRTCSTALIPTRRSRRRLSRARSGSLEARRARLSTLTPSRTATPSLPPMAMRARRFRATPSRTRIPFRAQAPVRGRMSFRSRSSRQDRCQCGQDSRQRRRRMGPVPDVPTER